MSTLVANPLSPYRGLGAFGDSDLDALFFFGREREREVIVANLLASRLTVLYGPSGVGKSSVLRAGVVRRVRELAPGADVVVLDRWTGEPHLPELDGEAYLVLDQLEEYFLYHGAGGPLADELPELLGRPGAHVLLAIRDDSLAKLDAFQARIPSVFANQLRLDELDAVSARAAIVRPLERWNELAVPDERVEIEPLLVEAVLAQVTAGGSDAGRVETPYLQLVLSRIWEEERRARSRTLRLTTLGRLGGAARIVRGHLEDALRELPPRDADLAAKALRFLVTPSRTKIAHTVDDLAGYTAAGRPELDTLLRSLSKQRILRAVVPRDGEAMRYEIFHDVLAQPVLEWRQEFEAHAAVERERRRHRRLLVLAGAAFLLAAAMAALAAFALAQRHDARRQAALASVRGAEAVRQAGLAERNSRVARAAAVQAEEARKEAAANASRAERSATRARESERNALRQGALAREQKAVAVQQSAVADREKVRAQAATRRANASAAEARRQAILSAVAADVASSEAGLVVDPVASVRWALAAAGLESSSRVEDALLGALVALRVRAVLDGGGGAVLHAVVGPAGRLVATGSESGQVRVFASGSHRLVQSFALGAPVVALAFAADGRRLLAAAGDTVVVRGARGGGVLRTLRVPGATGAAFAARGTIVTSAGRTLRIWDEATGTLLHETATLTKASVLALSDDGGLVAVFDRNAVAVQVVAVASGTVVGTVTQQGNVTSAAFSPDGALLVSSGHRNAYVWNAGDWSLRHVLAGHESTISAVAFGRDGRLVTASEDSSARIWDPRTGSLVFILSSQHQRKLLDAALGPDGSVVTASADLTARLWPSDLGQVPFVLAGHTDSVTGVSFAPDGSFVLTASDDGTARLWDARMPALSLLGTLGGAVADASFNADGTLVVGGGVDGTARIWRVGGGAVATLRHDGSVTTARFVGSRVLTASEDGTARLWSAAGAPLRTFAHGAPVRAALAKEGGAVITAGDDGIVRGWRPSGRLLWTASDGSPVTAAALAVDGTLATAAADGIVRLRRSGDGTLLHVLRRHEGSVTTLAFTPDGKLLVSGGRDGTARVWEVSTGRLRHVLDCGAALTSAVFSPDGSTVLTADTAGGVRTWSAASGGVVHDLRFHVQIVSRAAFSDDGRWIVTAGPSAAGLWQTRTGMLLAILRGSAGPLRTASFAPRGWTLLTGGSDGSVRTYTCPVCGRIPALQMLARARLAALRR